MEATRVSDCPFCGSDRVTPIGTCANCGNALPAFDSARPAPAPRPALPDRTTDVALARQGFQAVLRLLGQDPDEPRFARTPEQALAAMLSVAGDPAATLDEDPPARGTVATAGVSTLSVVSLCCYHLQAYRLDVRGAWVPGISLGAEQLMAKAAMGVTEPGQVVDLAAKALATADGIAGALVDAEVSAHCPGCEADGYNAGAYYSESGDSDAVGTLRRLFGR